MVLISRNVIEPKITSNIMYVDSLEEFEAIELAPNQTLLAFDNFRQVFYIRQRNYLGENQPVKIFFYDNIAQRAQNLEKEEFIKKCKNAGLDDLKTTLACMFFLENKMPLEVWEWSLKNTTKDWSWDYVKSMKCSLRKKLYKKL